MPNVVAEKIRSFPHNVTIPGDLFIDYIGKILSDRGDKIILTPAFMNAEKNDIYPVFFYSPRETIEYHIRLKSDKTLRRLTGVRFNDLKGDRLFEAWNKWWEESKVYYDFGLEKK